MQQSTLQHSDTPPTITIKAETPTVSGSDHPSVFTDIFQDQHNIAIWQRDLPSKLKSDAENLLASGKLLEISLVVTPQNCLAEMKQALQESAHTDVLIEDITRLVNLFCSLFELKQATLKLTALDQVMCPRFHVDNVPCRLVTSYCGCGTQWLPNHAVDRSKLGRGNNGLPDDRSGVYRIAEDIQELAAGDVALFKGARWEGNEHRGLVHRSSTPKAGQPRLLLTLDFVL